MKLIEELTEAQENEISLYRIKWQKLASTPISLNHPLVKELIKLIYSTHNLPPPTVLFYSSPVKAIKPILSGKFGNSQVKTFRQYEAELVAQVYSQISHKVNRELERRIYSVLYEKLFPIYATNLELMYPSIKHLSRSQRKRLKSYFKGSTSHTSYLDFCISVLHCTHSPTQWQVLQLLAQHCGLIYPYRQACIVCERPNQIELKPGFCSISYNDGQALQYFYDNSKALVQNPALMYLIRKKDK